MAFELDQTKPFYDRTKDGKVSEKQSNTAGKLIKPFFEDKSNPKAQALVAYMSTTDKALWDNKQIEAIAKGTATFHTGSGQSGSGQKGGFFLSALAGVAIPAIISAISGSGQGGAGFSPYKPKKQKNRYAYLK